MLQSRNRVIWAVQAMRGWNNIAAALTTSSRTVQQKSNIQRLAEGPAFFRYGVKGGRGITFSIPALPTHLLYAGHVFDSPSVGKFTFKCIVLEDYLELRVLSQCYFIHV